MWGHGETRPHRDSVPFTAGLAQSKRATNARDTDRSGAVLLTVRFPASGVPQGRERQPAVTNRLNGCRSPYSQGATISKLTDNSMQAAIRAAIRKVFMDRGIQKH